MTVMSNGGVKRKRHGHDDGFRVPIVQQSCFFSDPIAEPPVLGDHSSSACPTKKRGEGPAYSSRCSNGGRQASSTLDRSAFPASKREYSVPLVPSSARLEYRSMATCNRGRQCGSSTHSSRSSVVGSDNPTTWNRQSKSTTVPLSQRFPSTSRSSATPSRSDSSTSLLPPHLRPSAITDQDSLSAERYASSLRLLATWESIALKYADVDPEDDAEIDIATGKIVKGKEKVAQMPDRVIGGMSEDEEAEELGKRGKSSVKIINLKAQAFPELDPAEQAIDPIRTQSFDLEEPDPSDLDELDAWNDDDMEIQIEALPPSYTKKSRNHRPWTADDDVDLKEFLKAEERRKAMFGEDEAMKEDEKEQESSRSHSSRRIMDKEEAMSRRTVHASIPYFSSELSSHPSRANSESIGAPSALADTAPVPRTIAYGRARRRVLGSDVTDSNAEDELAGMFGTPEQSQEKQLGIDQFDAVSSAKNSPMASSVIGTGHFRRSSPSAASSYLVSHSYEGSSSSDEHEIFQSGRGPQSSRRRPGLNDEDICERELLDPPSDSVNEESRENDQDTSLSLIGDHSPSIKKVALLEDEARFSSDDSVEVVIEVPIRHYPEAIASIHSPKLGAMDLEEPSIIEVVPTLRRSSRHVAKGKSYALRNKRNKRPRRPQTLLTDDDGDGGLQTPQCDSEASRGIPLAQLAFEPLFQESVITREVQLPLDDDDVESRNRSTRSPSVIEGTPEPALSYFPSEGLSELPVILRHMHGHQAESIPLPFGAGSISMPRPTDCHTGQDSDAFDFIVPQQSGLEEEESTENMRKALQTTDTSEVGDDEDILLLGATFMDEVDIIWPETKPDITLSSLTSAVAPQSPTLSGETTTFRSIKGEKQELSTFTAPFRCSRIIDLTGDDICGDDEHDELDDW